MRTILLAGFLTLTVAAGSAPGQPSPKNQVTLTFIWHAGDLADTGQLPPGAALDRCAQEHDGILAAGRSAP